jgi:hypothetical protein
MPEFPGSRGFRGRTNWGTFPASLRSLYESHGMFGNLKGWLISSVIVALVVVVFVSTGILKVPPVSRPSGKIDFSEKITLPVDPQPFLTTATKDRDASEVYRLSINEYENNEKLYGPDGTYARSATALADADPKGVQLIVEAAESKGSDLFASRPDQLVHYNSTWPDLSSLTRMAEHTVNAGDVYRAKKDLEKAERYIRAGFTLGYRLYNERVAWQELNDGMNLMINASYRLSKLYQAKDEKEKAQACTRFSDELKNYKTEKIFKPIVRAVTSINTREIGDRGGDFFYLAKESPERVWRVEALLALGRMKYNTSNRGDQVAARREVKKYLNDPDPAVRLAAKLADELTVERYRMLGG